MKQTDINRLKSICEKEGFFFDWDHVDHSAIIIREKKDPWEGVEFIEGCLGVIYKVAKTNSDGIHTSCGKFTWWDAVKKNYKPSTETAYIEQLKKEAFERFGEIKDGDMFDRSEMGLKNIPDISGILVIKIIGDDYFNYYKDEDSLGYCGTIIYKSGKWAKKLPKRVKVGFVGFDVNGNYLNVLLEVFGKNNYPNGIGEHLSKCLEDYLNKEAGL
jgi:hypothetical protein